MSGLFSIRNKLLGAFLGIAIFSVGVTYLNITNQKSRTDAEALIARDYAIVEALLEMKNVASEVGREAVTFDSTKDSGTKKNELLARLEGLDKWEGEYKKRSDVNNSQDRSFTSQLEAARNKIVDAALSYLSLKEQDVSGTELSRQGLALEGSIAELKDVIEDAIIKQRANTRAVSENAVRIGKSAAKENIILSSIAVLIALFFGFLLNRLIASPIKRLSDGAARIAQGDLTQFISVPTDDEIGQLASTFNTMSEKLKESYDGLQAQVKQTTDKAEQLSRGMGELERLNKVMVDREMKMVELKKRVTELEASSTGPTSGAVQQV